MFMQFNIIGSNDKYYFFVAYEMNNSAYFFKAPIDFFDFDMNVEVYVSTYYEELIEEGLLTIIPIKEIYEGD